MLEEVKEALRVTENEFDNEIDGLIEAAKSDLETSGVASSNLDKPLSKQAIILYCKSLFGYDNSDANRFMEAYEHIKKKIAITYREERKESESDS